MIKPPASTRVFIAGMSGAGKSTAAWRLYLEHFPRRILLDQTGEWAEHADVVVYSVPEFSWALRKYAPVGRWTISLELMPEDLPDLVDYLIPVPNLEDSPIRTCQGAVMLADEVDLIAPPKTATREIRTLYRRSRHIGLSVVSTSTRPENVSKEVTAQCQQILCLQLQEPAAYDYMSSAMHVDLRQALPAWTARHPHGGLWREVLTGRVLWLTESGALVASAPEAAAGAAVEEEEEPGALRAARASGAASGEPEELEEE